MYTVQPIPIFEKLKNKLKKKYPRIEDDYKSLVEDLKQGVFQGDELQGFSAADVYKVRIASTDQKRGKRGGFRIIYYVVLEGRTVFLMAIYAKSHQENLSPGQKHCHQRSLQNAANPVELFTCRSQ